MNFETFANIYRMGCDSVGELDRLDLVTEQVRVGLLTEAEGIEALRR